MRKRIVSLLLSLALCLTLLPTAAFAEETQPEELLPGEQLEQVQPVQEEPEENEEQSQQDEDVIAVQEMINALPDASELDGLDETAQESACLAASEAYEAYDALTAEQQSTLTGTENMIAILEWATRQVTPLDDTTTGTEHQSHPICGANCTDGDHAGESNSLTWTPVSSLDQIKTAGNYYLTKDVVLTGVWKCSKDVNLCLNGKRITANGDFDCIEVTSSSCTLTLCDCAGGGCITHSSGTGHGVNTTGTFNMYGGTISGNTAGANDVGGGGVIVRGRFTMNGGTISGNTTAGSTIGGGVYVASGKTFTMSGGEITQNTSDNGGGVFVVSGGKFNMSGGTIGGAGNAANTAKNNGGGVYSSGTFTMSGGAITGNNAAKNGGGVAVNGTFTMSGGEITGNTASGYGDGGGVYVNYDGTFQMSDDSRITGNTGYRGGGVSVERSYSTTNNPGAFTMSSGRITDNNAQYGGGVYISGNFTMSGGEISSNKATGNSGGVHMNTDSTFIVSGAPKITGNTLKNSTTNNVRLSKGTTTGTSPKPDATITIGDAHLSTGASIGVTTDKTLTTGSSVTIATGAISGDEKYFTSDADGDYHFVLDGNEVKLGQHEHNWQYTLSEDKTTITAKCNATGCPASDGGSVTISAPDNLVYDGNPKEVTLKNELTTGVTLPDIKYYYKIGEQEYQLETGAKPTNAKSYRAEITVGSVNASVDYEIGKATPQASDFLFSGPNDPTYDGNPKTATVTSTKIDADHIKVKYYQGETVVERPTEAGTYTVKIDVTESTNYKATTDLTADDWKFTITANNSEPTVELPANTTYTYNGKQITPAVVVKVGDKTLTKDDYTVVYGTNINAGENAGSVTVKAKGNYGFADKTVNFTIAKKPIDLDVTLDCGKGFVYDGTAKEPGVTVNFKDTTTHLPTDEYTVSYSNNIDASNDRSDGVVTITSTGTGNYTFGTGYYHFKITPAVLTISGVTVADKTYNGSADATVTAVAFDGLKNGEKLVIGTDYEVIGAAFNGENVDTADKVTGTVALKGTEKAKNYTLSSAAFEQAATIGRADYNGTASKTVNIVKGRSTVQTGTLTAADFFPEGQMPDGAKITAWSLTSPPTAILSAVSVGGGKLSYLSAKNIATASEESGSVTIATTNYKDITATLTFHPTDKLVQAGFKFENGSVTKTYGDEDFTLTTTGKVEDSTVTYVSSKPEVAEVDSATGKVTIKGAGTAVITAKASATEDYDEAAVTCTLTVEKKPIAIPAADATVFTYNGTEQTYALAEDGAYTITGNKQTNANETGYSVTVALKDTANTQWVDGTTADKTYTFVIGKAVITVKAKDQTAYVGDKVPALSEDSYTVSGLVGEEKLTTQPTVKYVGADGSEITPDMTKTGEVKILADGAAASGNYTIRYEDGKLTVSTRPSGGGGGSYTPSYTVSVDKTENGTITVSPKSASKGDTVTITVKPDKGYELEMLKALDKDGDALKLTEKNGKYTFKMPSGKVTVKGSFVEEAPVQIFKDVPTDAYYYEAVKWAAEKGITGGVGNDLFAPNQPCTRAQIVTFLWRAAGSPAPKHMSSFADVPADAFYAKAVAWAVENGITGGTGDGKFSPDATCTRAQAVTFLYRAAGSPKVSGSAEFGDVATNAYYADAVAWAAKNGITGGIGGGLFGSNNDCTRAQIVTFLYRSVK